MPVTKSAKKALRKANKKTVLKRPISTNLKSTLKKALTLIKDKKAEELKKFAPIAFKVIDTACKKYLIHKNTANRKKALIGKALNAMENKGGVKSEK